MNLCRFARRYGLFAGVLTTVPHPRINGQENTMATQMTKSQLIEKISSESELPKKDVKGVLETLATIGYKELKKTGVFLVPGFAKFVVRKYLIACFQTRI
jgi:hypothetical protein